MSKRTLSLKRKKNVCLLFSLLCTFGPILYFGIQAVIQGVNIGEKATIDLTFLIIMTGLAAIFTLIGIFRKYVYRSIPYFIILGVFFILESIVPLIITMGICTIFDELIFNPLYLNYKSKYTINKEIDKRGTV